MPTRRHRKHFDDDIVRAEAVLSHAGGGLASQTLADDICRASVVLAVASLDAYFCDAYVDVLTCAFRAHRAGTLVKLPKQYAKESLPAGPLVANHYTTRPDWSLRMAARGLMERDNLLQVGRLKEMFNPVLPAQKKLWGDLAPTFIALGRKRLTGVLPADIAGINGEKLTRKLTSAGNAVLKRIGEIIQRRHDVAHNFDRPKQARQPLTHAAAIKMIADVKAFVVTFDDHLEANRTV